MEKINFKNYGEQITELWQPYDICYVNETALRIAKIKGTYQWHVHKQEDEFFFVISGRIHIDTEVETVTLNPGEGFLVKKGMRHRSRSEGVSVILLIEPIKTKTKGEELE